MLVADATFSAYTTSAWLCLSCAEEQINGAQQEPNECVYENLESWPKQAALSPMDKWLNGEVRTTPQCTLT